MKKLVLFLALSFFLGLPNTRAQVATTESESTVLHQGTWTKKSFRIKGTWKIVKENEVITLILDKDFKTKKGPDLKLFLSKTPLDQISNQNIISSSTLISPLNSHKGTQKYEIKKDISLSDFQTLVVHCEKYTKLWGGASLQSK